MRSQPRRARSVIPRQRYDDRAHVDPNSPGSPGYSERHRRKVTEIAPGMLRVDIGCEGD